MSLPALELILERSQRGDEDLSLPTEIALDAVGGLAALLQVIISWSRQEQHQKLKMFARDPNDPTLIKQVCSPLGLLAVNMARNIVTSRNEPLSRGELLLHAESYVRDMHEGPLERLHSRQSVAIICLDNARYLGKPARLYNSLNGTVRDRIDITTLLLKCLDILIPRSRLGAIPSDFVKEMSSLVYEAFDNTDLYAQHDLFGNRFDRSTRGVIIGYRTQNLRHLQEDDEVYDPIKNYYRAWRTSSLATQNVQLLELSIFDSGPGIAQHWLMSKKRIKRGIREDNVDLKDEYQSVLDAIRRRGTSKDDPNRGNGLFRIMKVVEKHGGFIRMRTGHLSLVQTFATPESRMLSPYEPIPIDDIVTGRPPVSRRNWAHGALITVLIPLNRLIEGL